MLHLPKNIKWSVLKNATSQIGGRVFLSLARLVISILIVRYAGVTRFGEYALVVSILILGEWLVDFGFTEISVRDMCQSPKRSQSVLNALAVVKALQGVLVYFLVIGLFYALDYPDAVIRAGIFGGVGLIFYSGALVLRAGFRFRMEMDKDVLSEVIGVLFIIPLIWVAGAYQASLEILVICYALSRVIFFFCAFYLGRKSIRFSADDHLRKEIKKLVRDSIPLGVMGLLVSFYETLIPIFLSKMADMEAVAFFACAMRFVFPVIIVLHAIGHTVYPLLSSYWQKEPEKFEKVQEAALNASLLVASAMFCLLYSMAEFLMGLVDPKMVAGAFLLKLLSWVVLIRTTTTVVSPLIIIPGGQKKALWITVLTLILKVIVLSWLIPIYGLFGAGIGYIGTELVGVVPVVLVSQYLSGVRLKWLVPFKSILAGALVIGAGEMLGVLGFWWSGILVFPFFILCAFGLGALSLESISWIGQELRNKMSASRPGTVE